MKKAKKILTLTMILVMITSILLYSNSKSTISSITTRKPVKVGVLLNQGNVFNSLVAKSLEDIQNGNKDKVEFTFFDGKGNTALESEMLTNIIQNNYDLILANIVDTQAQELINDSINKAKQRNIPLIFFNITPTQSQINTIKEYSNLLL